ncbi:MAG: hypothetical protein KH020_13150 [Clostridiales bacterium]|nr:hypothetical protein [Clostridiales bacterium]
MKDIERLIILLKKYSKDNGSQFAIGEMTSKTSVMVDTQEYKDDDLMIASHLRYKLCNEVFITTEHNDNSRYLEPLKKGDIVFLYFINDEKIAILERLEELG